MRFLNFLENVVHPSNNTGRPVVDVLRTVVNSPAIGVIVAAMNNPIESLILGLAKEILPPTPSPTPVAVPSTS